MAGSWVVGVGGAPAAGIRLFCFPHAGAGATFFHPWRAALRPDVEVCPVVLPGRESRIRERPYRRMDDLLPALVAGLLPLIDGPYAILGHSTGAAVGYEVARALSASPVGPPRCLFVSGRQAPHQPTLRPRHRLPEAEFAAAIRALGGTSDDFLSRRDLLDTFLPTLRADFELNETYAHLPGVRLACPVSGLTGDTDPEVDPVRMRAWGGVTSGPFRLRVFAGDHFYLAGAPASVTGAVRTDLAGAVA